ncbi:putative quinol monooxygenase [Vibrio porteresiae]|uniref:Antibiotic biosynthesis monooxygenase n=1 Tax=Vibrio porteresiae DSM 19223 TaxID=1123496 RepID=A0ABZ0QI51_9VIBR|nr:antibiotic biosynthesis monooxygenase [Vibrio porteresiae]WPC75397.1 antibiotic biosynthesis monooxygenase [Vibrio porteresiae DSM 19223]
MDKVVLSGYIIVPADDLAVVQQELLVHKALTRAEAGCLVFEVTQNADNPLRFDVYEEFIDAAAFNSHQQRVKASQWGAVTQAVERHYQVMGLGEITSDN